MIYLISNDETQDWWDNTCSIEDMWNYFQFHDAVSLDTETSGLSFIQDELLTLQFGDDKNQYVINIPTLTALEKKMLVKFMSTKTFVIQNAAFDLPFLYNLGVTTIKVYDTYLAEYVLTMGLIVRRSLSDIAKKYLNIEISKEQRNSIMTNGIQSPDDLVYCAIDVAHLLQIKECQEKEIIKYKFENAVKLENEFVRVIAYLEYCGIHMDADAWFKRTRRVEYEEYGAYLELLAAAKEAGIPDVEWDSPKQVEEAFASIGINTFNKKENKNSVSSDVINKQASKFPIISKYIKYKEMTKEVSTYGRNWLDYLQKDNRIHTKFRSIVDTARTSCGNVKQGPFPNLQNLDSAEDTRACFKGQGGNVLVIGDYTSQESVLMAETSREPSLMEFFLNGEGDMHSYIAREIFPELKGLPLPVIKKEYPDKRTAAKSAGFAIQYGGNGFTIAENMNISADEGKQIYESYFAAFPKLKNYFDTVFNKSMENGYITTNTFTNRKRFIHGMEEFLKLKNDKKFWNKYWDERETKGPFFLENFEKAKLFNKTKASIYNKCLNTPIQSTAADMSKLAGVLILNWIIENGKFGRVKIVNFVHDEYVLECNPKIADVVSNMLKENMEHAATFFVKKLKISVSPCISKEWKK